MSTILISLFGGELPAVAPHLLPAGNAQAAVNCDLRHGDLRPLKSGAVLQDVEDGAETVFKLGGLWRTLGYAADVVLGPVAVDDRRIYWTRDDGAEYPKKSSVSTWPASKRMGVPCPADPLVMSVQGDGDANQVFQFSYIYTVVTDWGEESAPNQATAMIEVQLGQSVVLTGFKVPDKPGLTISKYRLYRGTKVSNAYTFTFLDEIISDLTSYTDTKKPSDIADNEALKCADWDDPDDALRGLILASGGVLAGFKGNSVYPTEPWKPFTTPEPYAESTDYDVVALGWYGTTIIAATTGYPYAIQGLTPDSYKVDRLPFKQACISKRGLVSMEHGVIYPSFDGLIGLPADDQPILTQSIIQREEWKALGPQNLLAAWYNGRYIGWFTGSTKGLIFDPSNLNMGFIRLDWGFVPLSAWYDAETDVLAVLVDVAGKRRIVSWQDGGDDLPYTWRSKVFVTTPMNFGYARILGRYAAGQTLTFNLYGDGALVYSTPVTSCDIFPLPGGILAQKWEVELIGTVPVEEVSVAVTHEEIGTNG